MSVDLPEQELEIFLFNSGDDGESISWDRYRENLALVDSASGIDAQTLKDTIFVKSAQRQRRTLQDEKPRVLAQEDSVTLQIATRQIQGYRDKIMAELTRLQGLKAPNKVLEVLEEEVSFSDDAILYVHDALRRKVGAPGVSEAERQAEAIFNSRAIKSEVAMLLKQKYDDLKKRTAEEFHQQIDRDFRQAVQELDKR